MTQAEYAAQMSREQADDLEKKSEEFFIKKFRFEALRAKTEAAHAKQALLRQLKGLLAERVTNRFKSEIGDDFSENDRFERRLEDFLKKLLDKV